MTSQLPEVNLFALCACENDRKSECGNEKHWMTLKKRQTNKTEIYRDLLAVIRHAQEWSTFLPLSD